MNFDMTYIDCQFNQNIILIKYHLLLLFYGLVWQNSTLPVQFFRSHSVVSKKRLIGRISDVVWIRVHGSDFVTVKKWGSDDGYVV
jgi:hypothetical protein